MSIENPIFPQEQIIPEKEKGFDDLSMEEKKKRLQETVVAVLDDKLDSAAALYRFARNDEKKKIERLQEIYNMLTDPIFLGDIEKAFAKSDLRMEVVDAMHTLFCRHGLAFCQREDTPNFAKNLDRNIAEAALKGLALSIENNDVLESDLDIEDNEDKQYPVDFLNLVNNMIGSLGEYSHRFITGPDKWNLQEFSDKNFVHILSLPEAIEKYNFLLKYALSRGQSQQDRDQKQYAIDNVVRKEISQYIATKDWDAVGSLYNLSHKLYQNAITIEIDIYVHKLGIDMSDIEGAWSNDAKELNFTDVSKNIEIIEEMESIREGSAAILLKQFGIKEFQRYPINVLINQYDKRDVDIPYVAIMYSNEDWNNALDGSLLGIKVLFEQLRDNYYDVRVCEFSSSYGVMKRLALLNKRYGEKNKISGMLFGAHGQVNSMETNANDAIEKNDLQGDGVQRLSTFFDKDAEIVLASCSTGTLGGFGQELAKTFQTKVHAPNMPTNIRNITASLDALRKVHFDVEYLKKDELMTYNAHGKPDNV